MNLALLLVTGLAEDGLGYPCLACGGVGELELGDGNVRECEQCEGGRVFAECEELAKLEYNHLALARCVYDAMRSKRSLSEWLDEPAIVSQASEACSLLAGEIEERQRKVGSDG